MTADKLLNGVLIVFMVIVFLNILRLIFFDKDFGDDTDEEYLEYEYHKPDNKIRFKFYISSEFGSNFQVADTPYYATDIRRDGNALYITLADGTPLVTHLKNVLIFPIMEDE